MLKRTMGLAVAIALAMSAGPVAAQTCTVGAYADANGSSSIVTPAPNATFDVYVVLFAESLADAVSYRLVAPGLGTDYVQVGALYGPDGTGINIDFNGSNVGLGGCFVGYNATPVVVAQYTFFQLNPAASTTEITISGGNENPAAPVFSNCVGGVVVCDAGPALSVDNAVATESSSFGAVKSLFHD